MLIVLELVKISGMGYASVVCLVGKRSTFSKYTESAMMHRPCVVLVISKGLRTGVCVEAKVFHDIDQEWAASAPLS